MAFEEKRQLLISRGWIQAVAIVMLFGFTVMGMLAYETYTGEPPIPTRVTDTSGHVLFTRHDILDGQGVFLRNGLMEYGSIFGHGAYLGPDFTADYLHRAALSVYSSMEENHRIARSCRPSLISRPTTKRVAGTPRTPRRSEGETWRNSGASAYFICIISLVGGTRPFIRRYTTTFP